MIVASTFIRSTYSGRYCVTMDPVDWPVTESPFDAPAPTALLTVAPNMAFRPPPMANRRACSGRTFASWTKGFGRGGHYRPKSPAHRKR
jgi:hypothetical protein